MCCAPSAVQITWPTITIDIPTGRSTCGLYVSQTLPGGTAVMQRCCNPFQNRIDHYQTAPLIGNGMAKMPACGTVGCLDVPWGAVIALVANCRAEPGAASQTEWGIYVHLNRFECEKFPGACNKVSGSIKPDGYRAIGWNSCADNLYGEFDQGSAGVGPLYTCPSGYIYFPYAIAAFGDSRFPNNQYQFLLDNGNVCNPLGTYAPGWIVS